MSLVYTLDPMHMTFDGEVPLVDRIHHFFRFVWYLKLRPKESTIKVNTISFTHRKQVPQYLLVLC